MIRDLILEQLQKVQKNIVFQEKDHIYKVGDKMLDSVSSYLEALNGDLERIPKEILETAIKRGNYLHTLCEYVVNLTIKSKRFPTFSEMKYIIAGINYSNHFKTDYRHLSNVLIELLKEVPVENFLVAEKIVYCEPSKMAGTIDLIIIEENEKGAKIRIIDIKSGEIKASHYAQVALYKYLFEKVIFKNKKIKELQDQITIVPELWGLKKWDIRNV